MEEGIAISERLTQPLKESFPSVVTPSGSVISESAVQPINVPSIIWFTFAGTVMLSSEVQ